MAESMSVRETDRRVCIITLSEAAAKKCTECNTTNSHLLPLSLIDLFPRHGGRTIMNALIMETTPVSICPYLSAFVVTVSGRDLS